MKLLDNEQIRDARDTAEVAVQTLDTIGRNYEPFGVLISSASARAGVVFFSALGDELREHNRNLAALAYDAASSLDKITREVTDEQSNSPITSAVV